MSLREKKCWSRAATIAAGILALGLFALPSARAQVQTSPGVARVSLIRGDVSMQRGDTGDWSVTTLNTPLVNGDSIATGDASRAEVQLDFANVLRLDDHSQAQIATLSREHIQVQVAQGLVDYAVLRNGSGADVEIDTPNVAVHPLREGVYRIEVDSGDQTRIIVRRGEAEISTPQGSTQVRDGQLITVRGTSSQAEYQIARAPSNDDWDRWNQNRDNVILDAKAWRYTNRYYTGSADLDAYGTWRDVPGCGSVWVPRVAIGWAPYRLGRWVWEPFYGWTWVSYEPWGWAPYHYGRWFLYAGSWVWWPGPVYAAYRPIWAPAYVSFFGFGGGFGFGFGAGFGSIGWLPVGPGDYYHPWYGAYRDRFTVVNLTNINVYNGREGRGFRPLLHGDRYSNFRGVLTNNRLREGISNVAADRFGRGGFHNRSVSVAELRRGRVMTGNLPVVPTRESLRSTDRTLRYRPSANASRERFFMKRQPAARPESFSQQASRVRQAIARSGGFRGSEGRPNAVTPSRTPGARPGARAPERGAAPSRQRENRQAQPSGRPGYQARPPSNQSRPRTNQSRPNQSQPRANQPQRPSDNQARPQGNWRHFSGNANVPASQARPAQNRNRAPFNASRPAARSEGQSQGNWRHFSGNASVPASQARPAGNRNSAPSHPSGPPAQDRNRGQSPASESRPARNEAQPQSRSQRSSGPSGGPANRARPAENRSRPQADRPQGRAQSGGQAGWRRFTRSARSGPSPRDATGAARPGNSRTGSSRSRPPLNLNKPIVRERSTGHRFDGTNGGRTINVRGRNSGVFRASPSYRAAPGRSFGRAPSSHSSPNFGRRSRPSYRSSPTIGRRSAPSFHGSPRVGRGRAPSYHGSFGPRSRGGASSHGSGSHRR